MTSQNQSAGARVVAQAFIFSCGLLLAGTSEAMEGRPPLSAACRAWNSHIAALIEEHRTAPEMSDDQIYEIIRHFDDARAACSALRLTRA